MILLISHHQLFNHSKYYPHALHCFEKPLKNKVNVKMFIKNFLYMNLFVWMSILFCQKKNCVTTENVLPHCALISVYQKLTSFCIQGDSITTGSNVTLARFCRSATVLLLG